MEYKVISADTHVDVVWLPADLFVSSAPAKLKDRMPRVEKTDKGDIWKVDGQILGWVGGADMRDIWEPYEPGVNRHIDEMASTGFYDDANKGLFHPTIPELRIKDQDLDGIQGEVIYGILGLGGGFNSLEGTYGVTDAERTVVIYDAYNQWLSDFCNNSPERIKGLACLTSHDPETATQQLRKGAEMGLIGGEMNVAQTIKPIYHPDWDVLWAASDELSMPISFHTVGLQYRRPDPSEAEKFEWISMGLMGTLFQLAGAEFMSSIIVSGACDRFPNFKFVLGECGIGWIPYVLDRMDREFDKYLFHANLSAKPSEIWRRQGYSTFQHERLSMETAARVGESNIMWGSDYPHQDSVWPSSLKVINQNLGALEESTLRKIIRDNAANLYGFQLN